MVILTDGFRGWLAGLDEVHQDAMYRVIELLNIKGVSLGFPYSSAIEGSKKLRELRVKSAGHALRALYAFDPNRNAVILVGGDKTGNDRFYKEEVPRAERIFAQYLAENGE